MKRRKEKKKLSELEKKDEKSRKITTITITLPSWMSANETSEKYEKQLAENSPILEADKADLERKISELDEKTFPNSLQNAIYKLQLMIITEKIQRSQSDGAILDMIASMAEFYDNTRLTVLRLEEEINKLPSKQRRKLNKVTKELAEKIETTLKPIKDAFDNVSSDTDDEVEGGSCGEPPCRLWS